MCCCQEFEDAVAIKAFSFQFINSYAPVYYLIFFQPILDSQRLGEEQCETYSCADNAGILLLCILLTHTLFNRLSPLLNEGSAQPNEKKCEDEFERQALLQVCCVWNTGD